MNDFDLRLLLAAESIARSLERAYPLPVVVSPGDVEAIAGSFLDAGPAPPVLANPTDLVANAPIKLPDGPLNQ